MVTVENVTNVYLRLDNRPGTLEQAAKAMGDRKLNIDAISLETSGGSGFARVATHRPREAVEALRAAGLEAYESAAVVAHVHNKPGELARAAGELAAAGINVESVLTTPHGALAFRTSDNERAAQVLKKL